MSVAVRTWECYPPDRSLALAALIDAPVQREPRHEDCPGGHHMPGVLGWHCPCPCHHKEATA